MKKVKFIKNSVELTMEDSVAAIYKKKGKIEIIGDVKDPKEKKSDDLNDKSKDELIVIANEEMKLEVPVRASKADFVAAILEAKASEAKKDE